MNSRKTAGLSVLLLASFSLFSSCAKQPGIPVSVMLTCGDGFTVTGENPKRINSGEDVSFPVTLEEGYSFIQVLPDGLDYTFDGENFKIKNVKYPLTVEPVAASGKETYRFSLQSLSGGGNVSSNIQNGRIRAGTRITVDAVPKEGYVFLGWSLDKALSTGEAELVSEARQYSFILEENTVIHANFKNVAEKVEDNSTKPRSVVTESRIVIYHPNGGVINGTEDEIYAYEANDTYYISPNTVAAADEIFSRDGYKLVGFSDTADGSGRFFGIGHTAFFAEGENAVTNLYCVWKEYSDISDFEFRSCEDGLELVKYNGDEEEVVIPERVNGKNVISIASGAISGENIRSLYLPFCLTRGESGAVTDCPNLAEITLSDALKSVPNDFFSDTAVYRTVHLNAAVRPAFSGYYRNFSLKYQYLMSLPDDRPKVAVLSGSNTDHGVDTLWMEQQENGKYYFINYGTDAAFNITLYLDCVSHMLGEGDYLLHNFEQMDYCKGTLEINAMTFQGLESTYNILSLIDMSKYGNFLGAICEFNEMRSKMGKGDYVEIPNVHNKRGEKFGIQLDYNRDDFRSGANGTFCFGYDVITKKEAENLSGIYREARSRGVNILITYPSFNYNAIDEKCRNEKAYSEYDRFIRENMDAPLISKVSDYIFEGKYMSNTDYHLNEHGRKIRTENLLRDFKAYLEKH